MEEKSKPKFETVMLIDDIAVDLFIASRNLNKHNFSKRIIEFVNGEKALNYLREHQENIVMLPDVIFLDLYMPVMDGFGFMESYDKLSVTVKNHCKIYVLSSSCDAGDIARVRSDNNAYDILEKPITRNYLENINPD